MTLFQFLAQVPTNHKDVYGEVVIDAPDIHTDVEDGYCIYSYTWC